MLAVLEGEDGFGWIEEGDTKYAEHYKAVHHRRVASYADVNKMSHMSQVLSRLNTTRKGCAPKTVSD